MKYWNARRLRRMREKRESRERQGRLRRTAGDAGAREVRGAREEARRMLEALGRPVHRRMLRRLRERGAMSVSHLARPFGISLPDALRHVHILEEAALITTEKRGRVRYCAYSPEALRRLAAWLSGRRPFDVE